MDLAVCQDRIRDESQTCQQCQSQLKLLQLSDGSRAHRVSSELWGTRADDAVDRRGDGRSLRQITTTGEARDGGRPFRDDDLGFGCPVGFAVGATAYEDFRHRLGNDEVRQPRMHNSQAEREPNVQARNHIHHLVWNQDLKGLRSGNLLQEHRVHRHRQWSASIECLQKCRDTKSRKRSKSLLIQRSPS